MRVAHIQNGITIGYILQDGPQPDEFVLGNEHI